MSRMFLLGFLYFFFKELTAQTGENIYDVSCYNKYDKGVTYNGIVSTGFLHNQPKRCRNWKSYHTRFTKYYPDHNYCRNPRTDAFNQPWCYTGDNFETGICDIPVCDCRNSTTDLNYNGNINTTRNGHTCRLWNKGFYYTNLTVNYCRTPPNDRDNGDGPWCFIDIGWDRCNIPVCGGSFCPDLSTYHLLTMDRKSKYQYGEIAIVVSCQKGYRHIEKTYLECSSTGTWNDTMPTCEEITCQPLTLDNSVHASIQPHLTKYVSNTRVRLSCIPGYTGLDIEALCQANGQWSFKQTPICTQITCQPLILDNSVHAIIQPDLTKYVFNTRVTMACIPGYTGSIIATVCQANGQWSSQQTPRYTQITCQPFKLDNNSHASIQPQQNKYVFNTRITLSCIPGYTGLDMIAVCKADGQWSSQQTPRCTPVTCNALRQVPHQKLEPVQIKYSYRNNVTFKCNEGYELTSGKNKITCQSDGTWNNKQPNCTGVPCPHLPMIDKALLPTQTKEYRYPDTFKVTCETGYVVESSDLLQCNSSGFWNSIPRCTCIESSQSYKDSMKNRGKCISYGIFGGILATIVSISAALQIATCFYYRKQVGKPAAVYEDMHFNTVERQKSSKEETYSELT